MEKFYPTKAGIEYAALTAQGKIIEFTKGKFGDGVRSTENITELTEALFLSLQFQTTVHHTQE